METCVRSTRDLQACAVSPAALVGALALIALGVATPAQAQDLPSVSVGAGIRTSFVHSQFDDTGLPEGTDNNADRLLLESARIYLNGSVTKQIKVMSSAWSCPAENSRIS